MADFATMQALLDYVRKKVNESLQNEVAENVRETEQKHIISDVYGVYNPIEYERRLLDGGLMASENIKGEIVDDMTLQVTNETPANPYATSQDRVTIDKNLPELIEYGESYKGYHYDFLYNTAFLNARPFTKNTFEELQQSGSPAIALVEGLKKRGIQATVI